MLFFAEKSKKPIFQKNLQKYFFYDIFYQIFKKRKKVLLTLT